jgi:hypothetical protein
MTDQGRNRGLSTADIAAASDERGRKERDEKLVVPPVPGNGQQSAAGRDASGERAIALLDEATTNSLRTRWMDVQTGFVDEPRQAVEQADGLVAEVMKRLAESFVNEREQLERQWSGGGDVSTEDLRQALRRYRSFFDRLLSF